MKQLYNSSPDYPPFSVNIQQKVVKADIVFGIQSKHCAGNGICRMYPQRTVGRERHYIHFALAQFSWDIYGNLLIAFDRRSMRSSTLRKFFFTGWFLVEETVELSDFICQVFQQRRILIREGIFKVKAKEDQLTITINPQFMCCSEGDTMKKK